MIERDESIIDQTIEFWQSRTSEQLTRESARQIVANVSGFFQVLAEWDAAQRKTVSTEYKPANEFPAGFKRAVNDDITALGTKPFSDN